MGLDWNTLQEKWQKHWQEAGLGKAVVKKGKEKFFMIFAYPGISGFLHVGHMRGFSYTDAICRYERLQGKVVLFPVGTHASGNQAIAFAAKVKRKDPEWLAYLRNNGCSEEKLKELTSPQKIIEYFNEVYVEDYWKKFGFLCDYDRFTCTTYPDYEKFIHFQFEKLKEKGLLTQKPYFATACIACGPVAVDPSETDISKGGNAEKQEYTLLKFQLGSAFLVAATLRPETLFGQTNLWINPDARYVKIDVDGEEWIVSLDAAEKLRYQKDDILLKEDVDPKTLLGKLVLAPGIDREIMILPAAFCDPKRGSGIVTSVPSDAPYDYLALKLLQQNREELEKYKLSVEEVRQIRPIPIIITKGYGEFPGQEIIEKQNISSFSDPILEEKNKEIYKQGFHTGVMGKNSGKYEGMKVEQAKEMIKADLLESKRADVFYDLSEEVICRCGNPVIIKRIDDQWFIRYSDQELTERSKEQVREMRIYPQEYQENLPSILDWFGDRACARLGNWLGSTFPFDSKWIIEPISDSTLYPAYYIVSKFINNKTIDKQELTTSFFDYVFLGKGEGKEKWKPIREEFDYFYPLDMNLGGKEHKTVHFPVFIMNHVAILPEEKWPQGILVNWWVTGKGSKISKSKGGAEPIPSAIEKYGVDSMRLYYAHSGSPHVDITWTEETVIHYKNTLERLYSLVEELRTKKGKEKAIDAWLVSRLHEHLKHLSSEMKKYELRELASLVYFTMYDDLRWYMRRGGENKKVIDEVILSLAILMNPITPHVSEEIGGAQQLISSSLWPVHDESKINRKANALENFISSTMDGMRNVIKLAKIEQPSKFMLFVAEDWLYDLYKVLAKELRVTKEIGEVMRRVLSVEALKGKDVNKIVGSVIKDPAKIPAFITSQKEEVVILEDAREFLQKEFSCRVEVVIGSDHAKAKSAVPGKVGILVE